MSSPRKLWMRASRLLARLLPAVLLGLCALECGVRVAGAGRLPAGLPRNHPLLRRLEQNVCRFSGTPEGAYFAEICTNDGGLRDREHSQAENPRVLGLGDSATLGWSVEQSDTFLAHLERALRLRLRAGRAGVFNAALTGTSQVHQDALLRHLYPAVRPDVVVLAFSEQDDVDENMFWNPHLGAFPGLGEISAAEVEDYRTELRAGAGSNGFLFRHSALLRFFEQRHARASAAAEVALLDERLQHYHFERAALSERVAGEALRRFRQTFSADSDTDWRLTELVLERMRGFVQDRGAELVLLRIPSRASIDDAVFTAVRGALCGSDSASIRKRCGPLSRDRTAQRLAAYSAPRGVTFVDPAEDLSAAVARGQAVYFRDEGHLTPRGHALIGERLARAVLPLVGGALHAPGERTSQRPPKQRRVGAYWYSRYRTRDWSAFAKDTPRGGGYVSSDPLTIARQLHSVERAELDFLLVESLPDTHPSSAFADRAVDALVSAIVERRRRGESRLQFALLADVSVADALASGVSFTDRVRGDLDRIWRRFVENYRDAYLHVDGKPLVAVLSPPSPIEDGRFTVVRPAWLSHEKWLDPSRRTDLIPVWDEYPQAVPDRRFVSVLPGYDASGGESRLGAGSVSRSDGRTFVAQWQRALEVDPDIVLVHSYNDYFDRTQIEPTVEDGDRYVLLNQLLARRFKDGLPLERAEADQLADVLEPPVRKPEDVGNAQLPQRRELQVGREGIRLEGFLDVERHSSGEPFAWSGARSKIAISGLSPGTPYRVTLTFIDTAGFADVELGPDLAHLERVAFTRGGAAALEQPMIASPAGTLEVSMQTPTWQPSKRLGSKDTRVLGLGLCRITVEPADAAGAARKQR